jgi:hypothetical protein
VGFLEPIRSPQRTNLAELPDDVLLGLAAAGDLLEDCALLLGCVGTQDPQRVDPVEQQVVEQTLVVAATMIAAGRLRNVRRSGCGIAHCRRVVLAIHIRE